MGGPEDTTVIGEVEGGRDPALAWVQLTIGERTSARERGGELRVRLDDGEVVAVEVGEKIAGLLAPAAPPREGRWREVAHDPRAAIVLEVAPGDHVEVRLAGWLVPRGARVAVRGAVRAEDGRRTIVARRIAIVDLDRGVEGDGAATAELDRADRADRAREEREAARRPSTTATATATTAKAPVAAPRPPRIPVPWRWGAPICLALGAALVLAGLALTDDVVATLAAREIPWGLALTTTGALALVISLAMWASRPLYEARSTAGADPVFHPTWAIGKVSFTALCVQAVGSMSTVPIAGGTRSGWWAAATWLPVVATTLGLAIWLARRQRGALRLARLILAAPGLPAGGAGWGRFEGTVVAEQPPLERTVRYVARSSSRTVTERAQDGTMVSRQETTVWYEGRPRGSSLREFAVAVGGDGGGRRIAVRGREASWAAPSEFTPIGKDDGSGLSYQTRAAIRPGDSIVVVGRVVVDGSDASVTGSGPESLLLFAAPARARATLVRSAAITAATSLALVAAAAGAAAAAIWLGVHT